MRRRCLCLLLLGASAWLGAQACVVEIRDLRPVDTSSGGAASSSSSSSALGAGGAGGGAGGTSPCPDEMVHVTDPVVVDANFCIDRTEVTQKQFAAFLVAVDNDVANTTQPDACATNETLQQTGTFCPDSKPNDTAAVNCVDWCDAYAYCAHYDKRLCGTLFDGSSLDYDAPGETDEWEFACSAGGEQKWPYGNSVEVCNCYFAVEWGNLDGSGGGGGSGGEKYCGNVDSRGMSTLPNHNMPTDVGTLPDCEGGYPGLFDMAGNVAEWTNRCTSDGPDATCIGRGGFAFGASGYDDCHRLDVTREWPRINNGSGNFYTGIRCCSDPAR